MADGVLWRIVGAACVLLTLKAWTDRPRPPKVPVSIVMSDRYYPRDPVLGTAYIEFRSRNPTRDGRSPDCAETPTAVLQHRVAGDWFAAATVTRPCGPHQVDPARDASTTWHLRTGVPGRYRMLLMYKPGGRYYHGTLVHWVRGSEFDVL